MKNHKYLTAYTMGIQKSMEYKIDFCIGLLSAVFPIIIQTYLWSAIYKNSETGIQYGYTFGQILLYTFIAGIAAQFVETGIEFRINEDIHTGGLGNYLVRPVFYAPYRLFSVLGEKFFSSIVIAVILVVIMTIFPMFTDINFHLSQVAGFIITILLGLVFNFLIFYCIGLIGLWFVEVGKLFYAIRIILIVFTGGIFPLEVFGSTLFALMKYLPFMYVVYFPTNVLNGNIVGISILQGIVVQLFWICVFIVFSAILWRKGLKQYAPVGG